MKFIDTRIHGYLDYMMGVLFLLVPSIFRLNGNGTESLVFYLLAIFTFFFSLLTDYELGLYRVLPMRLHLSIDVLLGFLLAFSPWMFGFFHITFIPHLVLGIIAIAAGTLTRSEVSRV